MRLKTFLSALILLSSIIVLGAPDPTKVFVLKNQFGEQSTNYILSSGLPLANNVTLFSGATAPVDGTTGDNYAGPGSLYIARDTGQHYIQTSLITTPVWLKLSAGSAGVTSSLLTGFVAAAGTVAAADTILVGFNKLVGNTQNLPVISNVLTGYVSGAGTVSASDSILSAIQKLNGNIGVYTEAAPSLTFDHSVGAKTVAVRQVGKLVSLSIPSAAVADGAGTVVASTALAAGLRPAAAVTFPAVVIDNGVTRVMGQVVVGADGVLTFSVLGAGFTNAQAAGWDAVAVQYAVP